MYMLVLTCDWLGHNLLVEVGGEGFNVRLDDYDYMCLLGLIRSAFASCSGLQRFKCIFKRCH